MPEFNYNLRVEIFKKFRTQCDFADAAGEHDTFVSMVINGRRQLDAERQKKWAKVLKCKVSEIFPKQA